MIAKVLFAKKKQIKIGEITRVISKEKKYLLTDISKDFHTTQGVIKKSDLKKKDGSKIKTNMGKKFIIFNAQFSDLYKKMKKLAQTVPRKDIGIIITETGIGKNSKIVDAGAGSGAVAIFLAHIAKSVTTYDIREDHLNFAKKNIELFGLKNIKTKLHDIYTGIPDKNVDVITLDVPEPWKVIEHASKALKYGGYLVSYSPCIPQVADFVNAILERNDFVHEKTVEIIQREWDVSGRKIRPKSRMMMAHSGFLSFVRKL